MRADRHLRLWAVLTLGLLLTACGFQLRGGGEWPESLARIHLGGDGLTPEYERYLVPALRRAGAEMVTDPSAASARLEIVTIDEGQDLLALGVGSTVRDFQLATSIDYRLLIDGQESPRVGRVSAQRAVQTSAFNVTAALAEARRVQGELRDEAVASLVRRLTAAN
jgi:LPS-assembly lipoprotein